MKKLVAGLATVCLVCSAGVYAAPVIMEKIEYAIAEIQPGSPEEENDLAFQEITEETKDEENMKQDVESYVHFPADLYPTEEEIKYIYDLIDKGYDPAHVMEAAAFWLDTDEPLSVLEELVTNLADYEEVKESTVEEIYNQMTEERGGVLTYADVKKLAEEGISVADIHTANVLSRKGVYDIHTILEKFREKGNYASVIREVYAKVARDRIDFSGISEEVLASEEGENILTAVRLSRVSGVSVGTLLSDERDINELMLEAQRARIADMRASLSGRENVPDVEEGDVEI